MEAVNSPAHYTAGKYECIDFISGWGYGYCFGNCIKYLTRYKLKNGLEDLKKAQWYMNRGYSEMEFGFKKVGDINAIEYADSKDLDDEVRECIKTLHRGIHIKQRHHILKAIELLEEFITLSTMTSRDGKKTK